MTPPTHGTLRTVTDHFGIPDTDVPFLNVLVHHDNKLCLDPTAIRLARDAESRRAQRRLETFFAEVLRCRTSTSPDDVRRGAALLEHLHEPNQTRLGMSAGAVAGHGVGEGIGRQLYEKLGTNPACRVAALTKLEDLALVIDGFGDDLLSDLTTRIVFDVLADFTTRMVVRYPHLAVGQTTEETHVWDPPTATWLPRSFTLPHVDRHQLLLVPRNWVFWRSLLDPHAFYNRFGTETVQQERTLLLADGTVLRPTKAQLQKENPHVRGLNIQQVVKYQRDHGVNLIEQYRAQVDVEHQPLTLAELQQRLTV